MTPTEQLSCNAQQIAKCLQWNQTLIMSAILAQLVQMSGQTINCPTLEANAAAFSCVPRQLQVPAMLWLLTQFANSGFPAVTFQGVGPPTGNPGVNVAFYLDVTTPQSPNLWSWSSQTGIWTELIG